MLVGMPSLEKVRGDTCRLEFTITDQDGAAADITGVTPSFVIQSMRDPDVGAETPLTATAVITDAVNGLLRVTIPASVTEAFYGLFAFRLRLEDAASEVETVSRGTIDFLEELAVPVPC